MAGPGRKPYPGPSSSHDSQSLYGSHRNFTDPVANPPSSRGPSGGYGPPAGYDGPGDDCSTRGGPSNPFPTGVGYDPARDKPVNLLTRDDISRNLEVPSAAYRLPGAQYNFPTDLPLRPQGMNTAGKAIQVRLNQFKVVSWPEADLWQYDIIIGSGEEKRGLLRAVWNSKTVQDALNYVDSKWLWDGNKIAWCMSKAPRNELRLMIDMDKERGRAPRRSKETGQVIDNNVRMIIRIAKPIRMAVIKAYLDKATPFDNNVLEAINFLDHCIRQYPSEQYVQIKRNFFARGNNGRAQLDNVIEAMKGVYASIRLTQPIGSNGTSTGLAVNVDVANGTFWIGQALHQAARNYCSARNRQLRYDIFRELVAPVKDASLKHGVTMSRDFKELRKFARLRFHVKHRGKEGESKTYTIKGFAFDEKYGVEGGHAKAVTFSMTDKNNPNTRPTEISVYDYFKKQYHITLEHWYLPLVLTEKDGMFPMEVCSILPNQRYMYKLDPNQTAAMIKFAVTRPKERLGAIHHGIQMLKWNDDPYLRHYGLKIDGNLTLTNARLLLNPEIQFGSTGKINPGLSGRWDLRGKKFFKVNSEPLKSWGVCVVEGSVDQPTIQNFLKVFIQTYIGHGGVVTNKSPFIHIAGQRDDLADVVTATRTGAGNQAKAEPQIMLFILGDKNSFTYERLKKNMDCRYGIPSQTAHIAKAQPQYCSNVCMKLNAKLGGTTSRVAGKDAKSGAIFFDVPTCVIGADVSHASPGSQQASMAALTMSMDRDACRYAAAVQTNGHRVEMITTANIRSMMIPLLDHWISTVGGGQGPQHIYYFRDGVSEGQYIHVLEQEVKDMKSAIKEKYGATVKFTVTVAIKRHHIRFFPKDGDSQAGDRNGNANPGTLVERDCTHPFEYDFYLCSHSAIQGTARPVHYHVLLDEANVPTNKFQSMIYQHCYQYMRSTTPVSLYPAVYYAHLASNRARAHEDAAASEGPRGGQKFVENLQAGLVKQSSDSSRDRLTEAKPLLELGGAAAPANKLAIKTGMWYI